MSKFSFNSMMMDLDSKIKAKENHNYGDKRLLERITGDLDFFKEREMKIQEFTRNNYDENFANMPSTNYFKQSQTPKSTLNTTSAGTLGLAFNSQTLQTEKEIRKIIEREIEPFIFSAKNDLRLNIENFSKDIADYKHFEAELRSVKELVHENKRLLLINQEENERKINDSNYKFKVVANQFENLKESMFDFSKKIKNFEKIYDEMQDKFINLEDLKQKFSQWENLNEKIFKQMEDQFAEKFNSRIKNLETNFENSKSQIIENGIGFNNLNYEVKSLNKQLGALENSEKENASFFKELKDKFAFFNSDAQGRFDELRKSLNSLSDTTKINLKNLSEEIEQNKSLQHGIASSSHRNSHTDKIETLNSNLLEIKLKFEKLIGKFNNLEAQVDEIATDFSGKRLEIDEIKKNLKVNEIDIKENEERNLRKFANKSETEKEFNEVKNVISQKMLNAKDDNYRALNTESALLRNDFDCKFDKIEKEILRLKDKVENLKNAELTNNNNLNISNTSKENASSSNLNSESLLDIQKLKMQVEELKKGIIAVKEESNSIKNDLENQKATNKELFDEQTNTNDLSEKTLDEFVNHIAGFESDINELKGYKDKNNENLAKIQESFKKVKVFFEKVNSLEEAQNVLTEGMQEILTNNEEFKTKTEQRFEEIETLLIENMKSKEQNEIIDLLEDTDNDRKRSSEPAAVESNNQELKEELIKIINDKDSELSEKIKLSESKYKNDLDQVNKKHEELTSGLTEERNRTNEIESSLKALSHKFEDLESDFNKVKGESNDEEIKQELINLSMKVTESEDKNKKEFEHHQKLLEDKFDVMEEKSENTQFGLSTKINDLEGKIKQIEEKSEKTHVGLNTKNCELEGKINELSNEIKNLNENYYSSDKANSKNIVNLDDLEEISNKLDELENQINMQNKQIEENKYVLNSTIEALKTNITEKSCNIEKQSSNLFNYFEKKTDEIITNFEKKNEDIEDSIKLIVKKIEELDLTNNNNNLDYSKNKLLTNNSYNNSKIVKISEKIEEEINTIEELNMSKSKIENDVDLGNKERILNLTTIEKDELITNYPKINACCVTNLLEKYSLKGSPEQRCEFKLDKAKFLLNKSFDSFLEDKNFESKNCNEIFGDLNVIEDTKNRTIPSKKFLKNLEYFKLNPIEFLLKKDEFYEYNRKFICDSQKHSNYLELEIKACDPKLKDSERLSFLIKNKAEEQVNRRFEEEENLLAFEHSIEDVKFEDTFSDFDN